MANFLRRLGPNDHDEALDPLLTQAAEELVQEHLRRHRVIEDNQRRRELAQRAYQERKLQEEQRLRMFQRDHELRSGLQKQQAPQQEEQGHREEQGLHQEPAPQQAPQLQAELQYEEQVGEEQHRLHDVVVHLRDFRSSLSGLLEALDDMNEDGENQIGIDADDVQVDNENDILLAELVFVQDPNDDSNEEIEVSVNEINEENSSKNENDKINMSAERKEEPSHVVVDIPDVSYNVEVAEEPMSEPEDLGEVAASGPLVEPLAQIPVTVRDLPYRSLPSRTMKRRSFTDWEEFEPPMKR